MKEKKADIMRSREIDEILCRSEFIDFHHTETVVRQQSEMPQINMIFI